MTTSVPILILAAGQSTRMLGRDKLAELVDGVPLLWAQATKALQVSRLVFVALPTDNHSRASLLTGLAVTILTVPAATEGIGGTLRTAVRGLPASRRFMLLLADLPEITSPDLQSVATAAEPDPNHLIWRGSTAEGAPGHPIVFDHSLRPAFDALGGDSGGESIIRAYRHKTRLVPLPGEHARRDLDTPDDWAAWRAETGR